MHVTVTSSNPTPTGSIVEFTCRYGTGRGVWKVGVPEPGREYVVELDVGRPLRLGVDARATAEDAPHIRVMDDGVALFARVEEVFDDQTVSLRLGDSLILTEYEGASPTAGSWLEVSAPQVELFDTGM